ncbi:MAG: GNAT family N-acetyltransferase [Oscillospiraceae bacterium]|jgi:GNAT superfamily N-acetyltransferase|nr:GNAT family N-acetyltransferase [Oscillospiraceae bacterium]
MDRTVRLYEELSMNAHPSLHTVLYDGWILRFSNGYTSRANSVNMLCKPDVPDVIEKITQCEKRYSAQNLPTIFKITPVNDVLDEALGARGYSVVTPSVLMTAAIPGIASHSKNIIVQAGISTFWQEQYFRLSQTPDSAVPAARRMQNSILNRVLCAACFVDGIAVAYGLCVIERDFAGLYDIIVDPRYRRMGYGRDLCKTLLHSAAECGAKGAYLQVVADNTAAMRLYGELGFSACYRYWYRVKPLQNGISGPAL